MFKLGSKGEIIIERGFNSGSYTPKTRDRTNVYLGETTKEDIKIRNKVKSQNNQVRKLEQKIALKKKEELYKKMKLEDYRKAKLQAAQRKSEVLMNRFQDRQNHKALLSGKMLETNPFVGSPFQGFGAEGEERIDPDNIDQTIDIVDANIPSAEAYGVKTWMEVMTSEYQDPKIESYAQSYTPGKEILATGVDYANNVDKTLVSFPKNIYEMTDAQRAEYAKIMEQTGESKNAFQNEIDPKLIKYGLYALAAWILLK